MRPETLRAKKIRHQPMLSPQAAQESMARMRLKEWRKANPARPAHTYLDDMAAALDIRMRVLRLMCDWAGPGQLSPACAA